MRIFISIFIISTLASCSKRNKIQNSKRQLPSVRFLAVGDIMLARGTEKISLRKGFNFPFEKIFKIIKGYDLAFCNLESIISAKGTPINKPITFEADTLFLTPFKLSGFNIINLSNNHALDYGREALTDCIKRLKKAGFYTVGAGDNLKKAYKPLIIKKNSLKIAFISFCSIPTGLPVKKDRSQIAVFNLDTAISIIQRIRDTVDFIILSLHWGIEYQHSPSSQQKIIAHKLIDNGADIVIGHHPHVIQEFEFYKNKPIIYSLGNFIFDQRGREKNEAVIFTCTMKKGKRINVKLWPIKILRTQPRLLTMYEETKFVRRYKNILHLQ